MILLGAGASVPFGIPTMEGFVKRFERSLPSHLRRLFNDIKNSMNKSQQLIGTSIKFDLESLMVVLRDLTETSKIASTPTFGFVLYKALGKGRDLGVNYDIQQARDMYRKDAEEMLDKLQSFVYNSCMKPIVKGNKQGSFSDLGLFFGSLFIIVNGGATFGNRTRWIFTTNWDLCLKQWLDYSRKPFEDGTILDNQGNLVLRPDEGWGKQKGKFEVVGLHGSYDLLKKTRFIVGGEYQDIIKLMEPSVFFRGKNQKELRNIFMIYPLEAVGYEQSVRSPYLDLLNLLKERIRAETTIIVIGFSFRDPTIASIFDEVFRERMQINQLRPLRGSLKERATDAKDIMTKVFLIDPDPSKVMENLIKQGYQNVANSLIPIEVKFPKIGQSSQKRFEKALATIRDTLIQARVIDEPHIETINAQLKKKYGFLLPSLVK